MSPEQATGDRTVDGRSDIYSLGAMTYEMLVGDPPYVASTSQAIIAKLLTEKPASVRASRPNVPMHVDAAIRCSLEKLAADRFSNAKEFADALEGKGARLTPGYAETAQASRKFSVREILAWSLAALLAAGFMWQRTRHTPGSDEAPVIRANFDLPIGKHINDVVNGPTIAVSPAGDMIAFMTTDLASYHIFVRRIDEIEAREVAAVPGRNLAFSPDGRWLAFTEGNLLNKVSVDGGQITTIGSTGSAVPYGVAWNESGIIYLGSFTGLWAMPASGGNPTRVTAADSGERRNGRRWPLILPGGKAIAYASGSSTFPPGHLAVMTIADGKTWESDISVTAPLGVVGDQLAYISPAGGLMAVRFDLKTLRPTGDPVQLDNGVLVEGAAGAKAALSRSGTLAYLKGRAQFLPVLLTEGNTTAIPLISEPGTYSTPRFSPDGGRIAMTVFSPNATDIRVYDIRRNTFTRLTTEGVNIRPEWSADGRYVIFVSTRDGKTGIWRQASDGSAPAEVLYQPDIEIFEAQMSPDMKWLLYRTAPGAKFSRDIFAVPLTGERKVIPVVVGPETESQPRFSPNGKWLVYQSNEGGRFEIYVRPFPENGARIQVSDNGGTEPIWSRSGRSLYYRGPSNEIIQVGVTTDAGFTIGTRKVVLTGDYLSDASHANYDVAPNGEFLMLRRAGAESQTIVVHNWGRELREKTRIAK